jgi:hypothetical protein
MWGPARVVATVHIRDKGDFMRRFSRFACIDWSGAATQRTPSMALAMTSGGRAVQLHVPAGGWSRAAVLDWLRDVAARGDDMLIGIDLSPALPFVDADSYFPGWKERPDNAKALWRLVENLCRDDPHWAVGSFLNHPEIARHFRQRGAQGDKFIGTMGRLRVVEVGQAHMGLRPTSCFNLVGAAQVGKSSLTGMRVLNQLAGIVPVWPFDPVPASGPLIVEIYTSLAAMAAGRRPGRSKIRDAEGLHAALSVLDATAAVPKKVTDHATDALVTAAWLRRVAHDEELWRPAGLTPHIAATEGWTFGVR